MAEQNKPKNNGNIHNGNNGNRNRKGSAHVPPAPTIKYIPELINCVFKVGNGAQFQEQREALADYCKQELDSSIAWHLVLGREMAPTEPTEPTGNPSKVVLAKYNTTLKHYLDKNDEYINLKGLVFGTVKRQCDPLVKSRLTTASDFAQIEANGDVVELMERIRTIVNKQVNGQYPPWQLAEDMRLLFSFKMHPSDSIHAHAAKWKELLKNVTSRWGDFGPVKLEAAQSSAEERGKLQACLFLATLDRGRYGHVVQELNNDYLISQKVTPHP
jgi:hypothetical protein